MVGMANKPLFGPDPEGRLRPSTLDVARAARIQVDAFLLGDAYAARRHEVGVGTVDRLRRLRNRLPALAAAVTAELVAVPNKVYRGCCTPGTDHHHWLYTRPTSFFIAWVDRPLGATETKMVLDCEFVTLRAFVPDGSAAGPASPPAHS